MADKELNILLRLKDSLTPGIERANRQMAEMGKNLEDVGRKMSRVGREMIFLGAGITGSFAVALNTASKYSIEAKNTMEKFTVATTNLQVTIAKAVLPTINQFANVLGDLVRWFQNLDPQVRNTILNATLMTGAFLLLGGTVMKVGGVILKLFGALMANPALLALAGTVALVAANWEELESVVVRTLTQVEIFFDTMAVGWHRALEGIIDFMIKVEEVRVATYDFVSKIPSPLGALTKMAGKDAIQSTITELKKLKGASQEVQQDIAQDLGKIVVTGKGRSSSVLEKFSELLEKIKGLGKETNLRPLVAEFDALKAIATQTAQAMSRSFGDLFFKVFTNDIRNVKEVFIDFGNSILRILSQVLAKWILIKTIGGISLGGGSVLADFFHSGGIVRAHNGLSLANDEVPIIAQTGEGVLSRRGMASLGSENFNRLNRGEGVGGVTINQNPTIVIQAYDADSFMRKRKEIEAVVADSMSRNGTIRDAMRRYS